jgi:drug/metabolite transporter (DMT)-like permease
MIATVPFVGVVLAKLRGDPHAFDRIRLLGLGVGLVGVIALVGLDSLAGEVDLLSVLELFGVAIGYAVAPVIIATRLSHVPAIGVIALGVGAVALGLLPWTVAGFAPGLPSTDVVVSVLVLGLVCTALAFVLFFRLLALVGPVRSTVITFINPAVAIVLGIVVLSEPLTWGIAIGFPLVLLGSYWATRPAATADP